MSRANANSISDGRSRTAPPPGASRPSADDAPPKQQKNRSSLLHAGARAFRFLHASVLHQLAEIRKEIEEGAAGLRVVSLDAAKVRPSSLSQRHESAFSSREFRAFVQLIQQSAGNVQPILVRLVQGIGYEIIFGHRRHRACLMLGLPVRAVVWEGALSDKDLFHAMEFENRGHQNPSAFDQGCLYAAVLGRGLYSSHRQLAQAIGVSHTWVLRAMKVARLPAPVLEAFQDPRQVQPKHAEEIAKALATDPQGSLLDRAASLVANGHSMAAAEVVDHLIGRPAAAQPAMQLVHEGVVLGTWKRDDKGRAVIALEPRLSQVAVIRQIEALLARLSDPGGVET